MDYVVRFYRWFLSWFHKTESAADLDTREVVELEQQTFVDEIEQRKYPLREEMLHTQALKQLRAKQKRRRLKRQAISRTPSWSPVHVYGTSVELAKAKRKAKGRKSK